MTKMKKLLALCLSIMMIISALPLTVGAAAPEGYKLQWKAGYRTGTKNDGSGDLADGYADIPWHIDHVQYPNTHGAIGVDSNHEFRIDSNNIVLYYDVVAEYTGIYEFTVEARVYTESASHPKEDKLYVYVDGKEVTSVELKSTSYNTYSLGYLMLTEGQTVRLGFCNGKTEAGMIRLRDCVLNAVPDPTFDGASIAEGATVNKSTDVITLDYSAEVTTTDAVVTLKNGDNELAVTTKVNEADNTKLDIILNETLDYEKDYTLSFKDITMASGFKFAEEKVVNFSVPAKADDQSAKTDTLVIDSLELDELTFTLEGTVTGSVGQAIKGRDVNVSFVFPVSEEPKSLDTVTTDAEGKFKVTYTLSEEEAKTQGGLYEFTAETEFAAAKEDSIRYISAEERQAVIGALEAKTTADEVETFFTTDNEGLNDDILGVDLSTLTKFGANADNFYKRLADATYAVDGEYSLETFAKIWEDAYALEDINLSDSDAVTKGYLDDADFRKDTGIDEVKFALLDTQKPAFVTAVTALDSAATMEAFGKAVNALFNDILALEFGKSDLTLKLTDASVYIGQSAYVEAELTSKATDVKSYTLKVKCPAEEAAEIVGFETENGSVSKTVDGKVATFTVTDIEGELEALGKLTYSSNAEASYTISVDGSVVYEVSDIEINCEIAKAEADITIKKNSGKSQSSSSSSFTSGGSSVTPVVKPVVKEEETNTIGDGFTDLASVEWAQDSIDYLYKKGIISEAADGKYRPNDSVTRAEFVKMLVSALRITDKSAQVKLSDVSQSDWYYEYVSAAVNYGLVLGDEKGNFRPNDKITRQDICVIISRAMDKLGYPKADAGELFYDDAQIASYAKEAVYRMRTHGIVNGTGDGGFAPTADATRAATAKIIFAFMKEANI